MSATAVISNLAVVHPGAEVGENVRIDPFAVVENNVRIGNGTHIQSHSHICSGSRIGEECKIFTGASIGAVPQDLKFSGEPTEAIVGDRTVIREYATVNRGTLATGKTVVGKDCLVMAYSHVAHDCIVGDNVIMANAVQIGGHTHIDDWAIIGGIAAIHQFERIGKHAMVGAGFRVMKDVPPYALAGNEPLGFSGVNVIGLKRRGFASETIERIRDAYRIIYQAGMNIGDGVRAVEELFAGEKEIEEITNFIRQSERGVIPLSR
ncbi:MAG: acyl-ACP--UDP-N-acetylglucosamine O-acyltransferase [Ignavibacteriae bacterium]|nr:acyl-ACP--UDP-N-acetylglucosamine O-acyltransferase [Ignavibacteriota bacterium]MCB9216902.1 acyl-ACP--UDP-N-acetylglucosamine O-acyltransferase [Ignavibacteria bacterium]